MNHPLRVLTGLALLVGLAAGATAQPADGKITVNKIKYGDLGKLVRSHKGKVVIVDFWADY